MSYIRRAASNDDGNLSNSDRSFVRRNSKHNLHSSHPISTNSPWSNFDDIFRTDNHRDENVQRNVLHNRGANSHLQDDDGEAGRCPKERLRVRGRDSRDRGIFRSSTHKLYSPIIGTPPRWAATERSISNVLKEETWVPSIRPSLSCPTSVFESPLFKSNTNPLGDALRLSRPYQLEKILSTSVERTFSQNMSTSTEEHPLGNGLETANISMIECDEDEAHFLMPGEDDAGHASSSNPMRNLSNTFEMLIEDPKSRRRKAAPMLPKPVGVCSSAETDKSTSISATKPSPTSVLGFDPAEPGTAKRLASRLTTASISMPCFRLHDTLRGKLYQGLVDRVSFYSVVRDINKEALDLTISDPQGGAYEDAEMHGKVWLSSGGESPVLPMESKREVVADDGKVHVHPNPKEEQRSVLVMACQLKERNNPNEGPSGICVPAEVNENPVASLGVPLIDEEWWLVSAIASRAPEEVEVNRTCKLLPTFYEAMGEKDAASMGDAVEERSSRTQLWKPGRSWWEAKSGKNPWVEPVVHNKRWRYLWPLIHYHKFIAKCIKKLKRNSIDVKKDSSNVSLFLRQEVCNVSDHLAFMSKYDSEEWTSALSHFDGWSDHDPRMEETLRMLAADHRIIGAAEKADLQSLLLRSRIDGTILKAMQTAKEEAGRDAYDYKDAPQVCLAKKEKTAARSLQQHEKAFSTHDKSFGRLSNAASWSKETHLRSTFEIKKRAINNASWSKRSDYHTQPSSYSHQDTYGQRFEGHPPFVPAAGYGQVYGEAMGSQYYHHQYDGYLGQYPQHHPIEYHHHPCSMQYNDQYGHLNQYYNGYYHPADLSFHEGMVFDNSIHTQDPYFHLSSMAQTPSRYAGGGGDFQHQGQYPVSPNWGHLNISQLPGIAHSPSISVTPSKLLRGSHPNRSFRKRLQGRGCSSAIDGKAKSLIMFPNQTNSPASRFVMSPQDMTNPYYMTKISKMPTSVPVSSSSLNQSADQQGSSVFPVFDDYSPDSLTNKTASHASMHSNESIGLMPSSAKQMCLEPRQED